MKVFLGGTCANTTWREQLIPLLEQLNIDYFNPVVENWTPECQTIEEDEKNNKCNIHLYVITPDMKGVYSIAEAIHSAHLANMYGTNVDKVVFCVYWPNGRAWQDYEIKSFKAIMKLIKNIAPHNSFADFVYAIENIANILKGEV